MPLYIKDEATVALVTRLAKQRGLTPQDAVRLSVQAEPLWTRRRRRRIAELTLIKR